MKNLLKKAVVLPFIVIVALGVVVYKVKSKPGLDHETLQYPTRTVEVITARRLPFRSRATAYGHVEPSVLLRAKTEVSGKVSYVHPALKKGGALAKGTVALRIEPTTFELSLDQSKAALAGNKSNLAQLNVEERTTRTSLAIAKKNLTIGEKELERVTNVWKRGAMARTAVDAEEQKVLQLRQQIEDLEGRLAGYTSRKAASKAQIDQSRSKLAQSEDTLGRTEIRLPFDARIGAVNVEEGEFASVGTVMFEALGTTAVEIDAQLPTRRFRPLLLGSDTQADQSLESSTELATALTSMKLEARVRLVGVDGNSGQWNGELMRISESIDPMRDTIGLVVAVDSPYAGVVPGKRPPLLKGMYASVEFLAPPRERLVLPRKALHEGRVYVAVADEGDDAYRLEIRAVNIAHTQGDMVVIDAGVEPGDRIVVTDVIPVVDGLPLRLVEAPEYERQLALDAAARAASSGAMVPTPSDGAPQ